MPGFGQELNIPLLVVEKWNAEIFAVFESFVYRIPANQTLSKLASNYDANKS